MKNEMVKNQMFYKLKEKGFVQVWKLKKVGILEVKFRDFLQEAQRSPSKQKSYQTEEY